MANTIFSSEKGGYTWILQFAFEATKEISIPQEAWLWIYRVHKFISASNPHETSSKTLHINGATETYRKF